MSERWGDCGSCRGTGKKLNVVHTAASAAGFEVKDLKTGEVIAFEGKHEVAVGEVGECIICGGTGHSGDANDYQG